MNADSVVLSAAAPATTGNAAATTEQGTGPAIESSQVIRGTVVRKRKYPRQISLAVRSMRKNKNDGKDNENENENEKGDQLHLVMVDRSDADLALPLEGCFVGSLVEIRLETCDREETKNDNDNDQQSNSSSSNNNNKHQHRSAVGLTLLRSSPDPNAIQTCLKLVADRKLPLSIFSWGGDNNDYNADDDDNAIQITRRCLLRATEHAQSILDKTPKDPVRRAAVKHLASGLKGEGRWEDYHSSLEQQGQGELQPRRRPSHIKRRHRTILERLEVSQSPLAAIVVAGGEIGDDSTSATTTTTTTAPGVAPSASVEANTNTNVSTQTTSMPLSAAYNLPDPDDPHLPSGRHPKTRREYLEDKKWPQLDWLVTRLAPIVRTLRARHDNNNNNNNNNSRRGRRLEILDVGGGRGDIAVAVAEAFPDVRVTVVDVNESSLVGGRAYYESRKEWWNKSSDSDSSDDDGDDRVVFVCDDFGDYSRTVERFDIVLAWHACGDLSDLALECSLDRSGAFVICPCCYTKRHVQGFTPSWIGDYCRVVPSSSSSSSSSPPSSPPTPPPVAPRSDLPEEKKEETDTEPAKTKTKANTHQDDDDNKNDGSSAATPSSAKPKPNQTPKQHQQQQQQQQPPTPSEQRAQEIVTIQRLAEINERPEITHRAMKLINTMRMRSLLALSSSATATATAITAPSPTTTATATATRSVSISDNPNNNDDTILVENSKFSITLEEYDLAYSSKNLVLVGVRK
eukprot:jgi/Psemu1/28843/gm1.28843_g